MRTYGQYFVSLVFLALLSCRSDTVGDNPETSISTEMMDLLDLIWSDMNEPHEGIPSGVLPSADWRESPRIGYGNEPPEEWSAMIPWGQVYVEEGFDPDMETRFQIRNLQAWYFDNAGNWRLWSKTSNIVGANYAEDFQNDTNIVADIKNESESEGGISATLQKGYNFHFWDADGRTPINPNDIAGVFIAVEARLISANPSKQLQPQTAKMMMGVGGDYWESTGAEWDQWTTNGDIMIGRFRFMSSEWGTHYAHTLTKEQLQNNPPPIP